MQVHLAFEACGFGYELAWWAREEKIAVTVIAPSRMERPPGLSVKTDRLDVGRMARQLEEGSLKGIYVPERAGHQRRQVVRTYGQAVKERRRAQVRLRSLAAGTHSWITAERPQTRLEQRAARAVVVS